MIRAILIDIGDVILDESELYDTYFTYVKGLLRMTGIDVSDGEFDRAFKECILSFSPQFTESLMWRFLKPDRKKCNDIVNDIHAKLTFWTKQHIHALQPGIEEVLQILAKTYTLALAGNQPSAVRDVLEQYGVLRYFTTTEVSEDLGIKKPDPRFFSYILGTLKTKPYEAIMVGDRLDNDIIPAKKLGMKTILVKVGYFAVLEPRTQEEEPDETVISVRELPQAVERIAGKK